MSNQSESTETDQEEARLAREGKRGRGHGRDAEKNLLAWRLVGGGSRRWKADTIFLGPNDWGH